VTDLLFFICAFGTLRKHVYIASQRIHLYPNSSRYLGTWPFF